MGTASLGTVVTGMVAIDETFRGRLTGVARGDFWGDGSAALTFVNMQARNLTRVVGDAVGVQDVGLPLIIFAMAGVVLFVFMFKS